MHIQKMPDLQDWEILELSYVRACPGSLSLKGIRVGEKAEKIIRRLTE